MKKILLILIAIMLFISCDDDDRDFENNLNNFNPGIKQIKERHIKKYKRYGSSNTTYESATFNFENGLLRSTNGKILEVSYNGDIKFDYDYTIYSAYSRIDFDNLINSGVHIELIGLYTFNENNYTIENYAISDSGQRDTFHLTTKVFHSNNLVDSIVHGQWASIEVFEREGNSLTINSYRIDSVSNDQTLISTEIYSDYDFKNIGVIRPSFPLENISNYRNKIELWNYNAETGISNREWNHLIKYIYDEDNYPISKLDIRNDYEIDSTWYIYN